ncbi:DUF969 domain-containing protein [Xylocopilactobacillus apicola]|uniref:Membrane protein n=1 Tax=Xylocopilactobacillus apicola TaxID=2932184 RepID=A0AAU9D615_9LACO|nr:DUF969 domain-containing protein [Xylocopilactobacillus apicola]BDR58963.1 membrane protein [Xylocopilactobacillus apicola]
MEYIKLLGILIIVIGFALKFDPTAVVIIAAVATGLLSGMDFGQLLEILGKSFTDNRMVTLYFLTLPMIGLVESHGLKEVAINAIKRIKNATPSTILDIYMLIREIGGIFGISFSGQVTFVRPLVVPMTTAAAETKRPLTKREQELIKGHSAAVENLGNFFAQNLFIASSGVLLISSTMNGLKYAVSPTKIVLYSIPMAVITFVVGVIWNSLFDRKFNEVSVNGK